MRPIQNPAVAAKFAAYPPDVRRSLLAVRRLILTTATDTPGVGEIEETLKWGEPAYLTSQSGAGSTIRIDWKQSQPTCCAMYFNCRTTLVDTFRTLFPDDFRFDGNRALLMERGQRVPRDALAYCITAALTYHLKR